MAIHLSFSYLFTHILIYLSYPPTYHNYLCTNLHLVICCLYLTIEIKLRIKNCLKLFIPTQYKPLIECEEDVLLSLILKCSFLA